MWMLLVIISGSSFGLIDAAQESNSKPTLVSFCSKHVSTYSTNCGAYNSACSNGGYRHKPIIAPTRNSILRGSYKLKGGSQADLFDLCELICPDQSDAPQDSKYSDYSHRDNILPIGILPLSPRSACLDQDSSFGDVQTSQFNDKIGGVFDTVIAVDPDDAHAEAIPEIQSPKLDGSSNSRIDLSASCEDDSCDQQEVDSPCSVKDTYAAVDPYESIHLRFSSVSFQSDANNILDSPGHRSPEVHKPETSNIDESVSDFVLVSDQPKFIEIDIQELDNLEESSYGPLSYGATCNDAQPSSDTRKGDRGSSELSGLEEEPQISRSRSCNGLALSIGTSTRSSNPIEMFIRVDVSLITHLLLSLDLVCRSRALASRTCSVFKRIPFDGENSLLPAIQSPIRLESLLCHILFRLRAICTPTSTFTLCTYGRCSHSPLSKVLKQSGRRLKLSTSECEGNRVRPDPNLAETPEKLHEIAAEHPNNCSDSLDLMDEVSANGNEYSQCSIPFDDDTAAQELQPESTEGTIASKTSILVTLLLYSVYVIGIVMKPSMHWRERDVMDSWRILMTDRSENSTDFEPALINADAPIYVF